MIKRSLFFILSSICLVVGFSSCVDGGNKIDDVSLAIINNNPEMGGTTMILGNAVEVAIAGADTPLSAGDCVYVFYTIDHDNQPTSNYFTATNVQVLAKASQQYATEVSGEELDNDTYYDGVMDGLNLFSYPAFKGVILFDVGYTILDKQEMNFDILYNPEEIDEKGALTLYLKGKVSGDDSSNLRVQMGDFLAFNLNSLIRTYGKPYTEDGSTDTMQLDIYIKYCDEVDEDGNYIYSALNSSPQTIYYY